MTPTERTGLVLALGLLAPQAALAQTTMQINTSQNEGSFAHVFLQEFQERVEAELGDEIAIEIFLGNTLGEEEDVLQGLGVGTHHATLSASAVAQINPRAAIFDLPYLFEDRAAVQHFAASEAGDMLAEGFEGTGMVLAAMWDNGFRVITNSERPIVTPSDLEGLRIRTPTNRQRVTMFNELGANATPMSFGEVYSALDQGVIDGQENPAQVAENDRFYEVQDYMSLSNHVYLPTFLLIGEPFLGRLDADTATRLMEIAQETAGWTFDWGDETDARVVDELADRIEINEVDFEAFQDGAAPLYEEPIFVDAIGADMIETTLRVLHEM